MLVIRFSRIGKRGERKYRLIVAEKRSKRDGKPVDSLGYYEKTVTKETKEFNNDKIKYWISQGAQLSESVRNLLEGKKKTKKVKQPKTN